MRMIICLAINELVQDWYIKFVLQWKWHPHLQLCQLYSEPYLVEDVPHPGAQVRSALAHHPRRLVLLLHEFWEPRLLHHCQLPLPHLLWLHHGWTCRTHWTKAYVSWIKEGFLICVPTVFFKDFILFEDFQLKGIFSQLHNLFLISKCKELLSFS